MIWCRCGRQFSDCCHHMPTAMTADNSRCAHQPRHPLATTADTDVEQFRMNAGSAVGLPTLGMDRHNPLGQLGVRSCTSRWDALAPGIVAADGDSQRLTEPGDGMMCPLSLN